MKFSRLSAVLSLAFSVTALHAQGLPGNPADSLPAPVVDDSQTFHAVVEQTPNGSKVIWISRAEDLKNLYVPPVPGAPFSATALLNISGPNRSPANSYGTIARDSAGRVYIENRSTAVDRGTDAAPSGEGFSAPIPEHETPSLLDRIYIDPVQHESYDCTVKDRLCHALPYPSATAQRPQGSPSLSATTHSLGQKKIEGLQATGTQQLILSRRETDETWYSSDLQIALASKRTIGNKTSSLEVKHLSRSEPKASLFTLPAGDKITSAPLPSTPTDPRIQSALDEIHTQLEKKH